MRSALVCCKGYLVSRVRPPGSSGEPLAKFLSCRRAVNYRERAKPGAQNMKASHQDVAVDRENIEKALDALLRAAK